MKKILLTWTATAIVMLCSACSSVAPAAQAPTSQPSSTEASIIANTPSDATTESSANVETPTPNA